MEGTILKPELRVPEQRTASLSFCETSPKAFRNWVNQLPMANIGEASRQLYHAIIELNHLFIAPQQRLQFLEMLRPKIHFVCTELSRHYLGLSVALPEKQRKIANLSQALQLHSAGGYKLCIQELLDSRSLDKNRKAIALAVHRAISELAATILRAHQLYCPSPPHSWLECHRLFRFAHRNKLAGIGIDDNTLTHRHSSTVEDAYKRVLLLGCARPNQLRQNELLQSYELFETWTEHVRCSPDISDDSLFAVNMEQDSPPVYRSLLEQGPDGDTFGFDTVKLSRMLSEALQTGVARGQDKSGLQLPPRTNETLLTHLSQALGILAKRNFNRISSQGKLEVSVGLTATHYYVAGEKQFHEFVRGNDSERYEASNPFTSPSRPVEDVWAQAHDAAPLEDRSRSSDTPINFRSSAGKIPQSDTDKKQRPPSHQALLVNSSPGGYCAAWESNVPPTLQAGEILGVREHASHPWSIAVVRWIRQIKHKGTQIGIELLAPSAAPCGVRLIQKVGASSEYLRGLLLPEISVANQAATLITPKLPFQAGSRISLLHDGREDNGQLSRKLATTGSISQFELKLQNSGPLSTSAARSPASTNEDEFDSLWPSL